MLKGAPEDASFSGLSFPYNQANPQAPGMFEKILGQKWKTPGMPLPGGTCLCQMDLSLWAIVHRRVAAVRGGLSGGDTGLVEVTLGGVASAAKTLEPGRDMVTLRVGDFCLAVGEDQARDHPRRRGQELPCLDPPAPRGPVPPSPALIISYRPSSLWGLVISSAATAIRGCACTD